MGRFDPEKPSRKFIFYKDSKKDLHLLDVIFCIPWYINNIKQLIKTIGVNIRCGRYLKSNLNRRAIFFLLLLLSVFIAGENTDVEPAKLEVIIMIKPLEKKELDDTITESELNFWIDKNFNNDGFSQDWILKPRRRKQSGCYYSDEEEFDYTYDCDGLDIYYGDDDSDERPLY